MSDGGSIRITLTGDHTPNKPATPYPPSSIEAKYFYHGLYSKPRLIARSSTYVWVEPRGAEAYPVPKELTPLGFGHPLENLWEHKIGPEMVSYLNSMDVKCSSLDPLCIGYAGDSSPPAVVWIGVLPGTLAAEAGVKIAIQCKSILAANGIEDVHVELCESEVFHCAKLYKPVPTSVGTVHVIESVSTSLGLPISTMACPTVGGTGGLFVSDPNHPTKLFLVTAHHVVLPTRKDDNKLVKYHASSPHQDVLLFSEPAAEKHFLAIKLEIGDKEMIIEHLRKRLEAVDQMDPAYAEVERDDVELELKRTERALKELQKFLLDVTRDWKDQGDRVIGHVWLSPPIALNVGSGFTEDWAIIKLNASKIDMTNFIGNVIDLGIDISMHELSAWMHPHPENPHSFNYPTNRLHKYFGFIPDDEMWRPNVATCDQNNDLVIMVMKCGTASGLTVGRLNTIRSFTRYYFEDEPSVMSKEVSVLPQSSKSGPFSEPGDSGSSVVDGQGRIAGLLMGGAGMSTSKASDCTYVTSINFICERMARHGVKANFFPSLS